MNRASAALNDVPNRFGHVYALLVGLIAFAGYHFFQYGAFTPELSNELAVVAGLRVPTRLFPGLWRQLAGFLPPTVGAFSLVGHLGVAAFAMMSFYVYRYLIAYSSRPLAERRLWTDFFAPLAAFVGAVMTTFAPAVWDAFQFFSPAALFSLFCALASWLFVVWVLKGGGWRLVLLALLAGLFAGETPLALVLVGMFFVAFYYLDYLRRNGMLRTREDFPLLVQLPFWPLFFASVGGLIASVALNIRFLFAHGGLTAMGWEMSQVFFRYGQAYLLLVADAAAWTGWVLGLGLCVLPFMIMLKLAQRAFEGEKGLPFLIGLISLVGGVVAYSQLGPFRGAWFFTWSGGETLVASGSLGVFFALCSAVALVLAVAIFLRDAFLRVSHGDWLLSMCYRFFVLLVIVVALSLEALQLSHDSMAELLAFNDEAVKETVRELNGAKWIFTDGSMDAQLELEAHRQGGELIAINLMGGGVVDRINRSRGLTDEVDLYSASVGAPVLLRHWVDEDTAETGEEKLREVAVQLGFDIWKRAERALPEASALVARTYGLRTEDVKMASEIARRFTERIDRLAPIADLPGVLPSVRRQFHAVSWRLSRMSRLRADNELADHLDSLNSTLKQMLTSLEYERMRIFMQLTPHEGLEFALKRADFVEASRYAMAVMKYDADDPEANFAMAMGLITGGRVADAEPYLRKVLQRRPNEPAALNNLSIVCRKQKRYAEALAFAQRAAAVLPDSEEVKQTLADALSKAP